MVATTLPDKIRTSNRIKREHDPNRAADPRDKWHFVDWPIDAGYQGPDPATPNALTAIDELATSLRSHTGAPEEQATRLAFLIHIVGDLHQPLHCATRYTTEIQTPDAETEAEQHGDRGGNSFKIKGVRVPGRSTPVTNLHAYWDALPDLNAGERSLFDLADQIGARWPPQSLASELRRTMAEGWSKEGRDAAEAQVYTKAVLETHTTDSYGTSAWDLAQKRLALAGYRLAALLNELFSK